MRSQDHSRQTHIGQEMQRLFLVVYLILMGLTLRTVRDIFPLPVGTTITSSLYFSF